MANDDLGNFPTPPTASTKQDSDTSAPSKVTSLPNFEPTPDELPTFTEKTNQNSNSSLPSFSFPDNEDKIVEDVQAPISKPVEKDPEPTKIEPLPATLPSSSHTKSSGSSLLVLVLLLIAGIGITGSVFLYTQSSVLKSQLSDITKTLEQQKTVITPTPTPTVIDIPTPTPTAESTRSGVILFPTPTATPSISPAMTNSKEPMPLALAPQALKVAINHEPNAQLILIKIEKADEPENYLIKYFFRQDLTTKKYFYVSINSKNESEINDKSIFVNPDNNIPSLNDQVLGNKLGIDFAEAYKITTDLCTPKNPECKTWPVTAQFIQSGQTTIWQLTLSPTGEKFIIQINSQTKEVLFKSENL